MSAQQNLENLFNHGKSIRYLGAGVFSKTFFQVLDQCHKLVLDKVDTEVHLAVLVAGYANDTKWFDEFKEKLKHYLINETDQPLQEPAKDQPIGILPSPDPHS